MSMKNFSGNNSTDNPKGNGANNNPSGISMGMSNYNNSNTPDDNDWVQEILINYNEKYKGAGKTLFRDALINQTLSVLIGKNKSNALLVGSAGVGKTKIVEDIARRIAIDDPTIPDKLKDYTIYELPLSNIVAGSGIVGEIEEKTKMVIDFISEPKNKAILFIDEIHVLLGKSKIYDTIAQMLKPALARGDMKVIGATTLQESKSLLDDPALVRRFSRLIVDELTREQTVEILKEVAPGLIMHHDAKIDIQTHILDIVAKIADEFSSIGNHRPDTAITLLDRACADAIVKRMTKIAEAANNPTVLSILQSQLVVVSEPQIKETAMLLASGHAKNNDIDIPELLTNLSKIKGQDEVITTILDKLERDAKRLYPREKPLTLLFAGTSGVGKTEITKIIANTITGVKPIILNMTEYHNSASINRIIGSPAGYIGSDSNTELPFDNLESNPYQIILLDEFEKADTSVQRLFMGAFDEGYIKTNRGKIIDFSKSIIIATTNAGFTGTETKPIGYNNNNDKNNESIEKEITIERLSAWFDIALLNRFNYTLTFNSINKEIYADIVKSIYKADISRIKSENRNVILADELDDATCNQLVEKSYVEQLGARPAVNVVRDYIETNA